MTTAVRSRGRLCVGIDPHAAMLESWGLDDSVGGLERFARICVEAFASDIGVVKPQVAFFERFGSAGFAVLERTIADLRAAGVVVFADAKRGDIGSTSEAYARAWLDPSSPLASDAVTVSPYLGVGALSPFVEQATEHGCGLFVLARTSNPEGAVLQQSSTDRGISVAQDVVNEAGLVNARMNDDVLGLVVGATRGHGLNLENFSGPILAPGMGAQGATPDDLPALFMGSRELLLPNSSRDVLRHGPDVATLRSEAVRMRDIVETALS